MAVGALAALLAAAGPLGKSFVITSIYAVSAVCLSAGAWMRSKGAAGDDQGEDNVQRKKEIYCCLDKIKIHLNQPLSRANVLESLTHAEKMASHRQYLLDSLGIATYSKVMTPFALLERTMNRALSALDDGYEGEAANCWQQALPALNETMQRLSDRK